MNIGNNKFSVKSVVKQEKEDKEDKKEIKVTPKILEGENDIIVGNTSNIQTHVANSCMPLPGDEIIGFITRGSGISIHR